MIKYQVYNQQGQAVKEIFLNDKVFGVALNTDLLHQATVAQMANSRQVLAHTKDRSEVAGGGKKPWRQKGTGRARVGSNRSPLWRSGGITFGPTKDRNFSKQLNKKMAQKALLMALSDKVAEKQLVIVDKWDLAEAKTKSFNQVLGGLEKKLFTLHNHKNEDEDSLQAPQDKEKSSSVKQGSAGFTDKIKRDWLIINKGNDRLGLAACNLKYVKIINLDNINLVDLLNFRNLLVEEEIVAALEKQYVKGN